MKTIFFTIITWIWVLASCSSKTEVSSPNGHINWAFQLDEKGEMTYHVTVKGQPFILSSSLGFEEKSGLNLKNGFQLINTKFDSEDETWTQPWGENKTIRSHYNEMAVNLRNGDGAKLTIRVRVFDDGLGFRYEYDTSADSLLLMDEYTSFNIAEDGTSWSIPAEFNTYELLYRTLPLSLFIHPKQWKRKRLLHGLNWAKSCFLICQPQALWVEKVIKISLLNS